MTTTPRSRADWAGELERLRMLLAMQRRVLGLVATSASLSEVLDALCLEVEGMVASCMSTVMLLDGESLSVVSGPSAPRELVERVDGLRVGEGSCGAAAQSGRAVIVADVETDGRWEKYREFARGLGVAACWSIPILSDHDRILGTFAIYLSDRATPDGVQSEILESAASIAAIAIHRDRATRSLRRAESTYRTIFESVNDAVFVHDLETGAILDVNPRMCEMYGCTREEALALTVGDISVGEGFDDAEALRRIRLAASGRAQTFEWRSLRRDGTEFWVEVTLKLVTLEGEPRVLAVVRDITERRKAERALRESEATLRSIMESSPDHILLLDEERRVRFINRTRELSVDEIVGRDVLSFIAPEAKEMVRGCFDRVRETRRPDTFEVEYASGGGEARTYESRVGAVEHDGEFVGFVVSTSDVTARKEAERAITESEERFRQLTEAIDDVFWLTDWKTRKVMYVSPSYEAVYGRTCQSLYDDARSWAEAIHPEDVERARGEFYGGAERGEYDSEYRIVLPDGRVRWIHDKAYPIRDERGEVVRMAGVSEDVTERKAAEEELVRRSEAERILRSELDHRVRNNLASLMTLIEMSGQTATSMGSFVEAIKGRVNAMATIHSFLSRTSWSDVPLREMVDALTPPDSVGSVSCEGEPVLVPAYQCNAMAVVLHELLHNSVKHGALGVPGGGVRLAWKVEEERDGAVRLRLHWQEWGGPEVRSAPSPGLGTTLIEGLVKWDLGGEVRFGYPREGADHWVAVELKQS